VTPANEPSDNPFEQVALAETLHRAVDAARDVIEALGFEADGVVLIARVTHPLLDGEFCSAACHPLGDWDSHRDLVRQAGEVFDAR